MHNTNEQIEREKADLVAAYAHDPNIAVMSSMQLAEFLGVSKTTACILVKEQSWETIRSKVSNYYYYVVPQEELIKLKESRIKRRGPGVKPKPPGSSIGPGPKIWEVFK